VKTRIAALALAIAAVLSATTAPQARVPKRLALPPIEFKAPKIDTLVFANGLRGYLLEDHEVPRVNIVIKFRTGYPADDKAGLNDVAGWALRNAGTKRFAREDLDKELEYVGASIESNSGPCVGQVSADFLTKDTDKVLDMLAEVVANPAFDAAKLELRKNSMIEEIRRKADEPYSLGYRELAKIIYRDHPAGREATVASVTGIARSDVSAFHSRFVRPDNAVIGISGDMTKAEAVEKIGRYLGSWKRGAEPPVIPGMKYENLPSVNYIYKDLNQAYIFVGHMGMNSSNPDVPVANIMDHILGSGSFTSWIIQRVRSDEGLAYDAGSSFDESPFGYGLFVASCQTRSDAAMRALAIILEEITRMKQQGPSQEEVNTAKDSFVNRQAFDYESSAMVIDRLVEYDITGQPLDTLQRRFRAYQAATLEDVKRVAGQYLLPEGLTILVVGNKDLFDRPLSDFGPVNVIEVKEEVP
jgi:zinc protease